MSTPTPLPPPSSHRIANLTTDALARGADLDLSTRRVHGTRLVVVTLTHRSLRTPAIAAAPTLEAACDRAVRHVARLPGVV